MFLKVLLHSNCNFVLGTFFPLRMYLCEIKSPKLHGTLCFLRFLLGSLWKKSSKKSQMVSQLWRTGAEKSHSGCSTALLWQMEDILFEITPCPLFFPICILFLGDFMQFSEVQFFYSQPRPLPDLQTCISSCLLNISAEMINWLLKHAISKAEYFLQCHGEEEKQWDKRAGQWTLLASPENGLFLPTWSHGHSACRPHHATPYAEGMGGDIFHSFDSKSNVLTGLQAENRFPVFGCHGTAYVTALITPPGYRNTCLHRGLLINHLCSGLCGWHDQEILTVWLDDTWNTLCSKNMSLSSPTIFWFLPYYSYLHKKELPLQDLTIFKSFQGSLSQRPIIGFVLWK